MSEARGRTEEEVVYQTRPERTGVAPRYSPSPPALVIARLVPPPCQLSRRRLLVGLFPCYFVVFLLVFLLVFCLFFVGVSFLFCCRFCQFPSCLFVAFCQCFLLVFCFFSQCFHLVLVILLVAIFQLLFAWLFYLLFFFGFSFFGVLGSFWFSFKQAFFFFGL